MNLYLVLFICAAYAWRLLTVLISRTHERNLRKNSAKEYGATNSKCLAAVHILFYIAATVEAAYRPSIDTTVATIGVVLYIASALILILVMRSLGELWTIKIMISQNHRLIRNGLFAYVRHPNYFLNILPELVGFALALNAFWTLIVGLPIYLIPLIIRIRQEEAIMSSAFADYKS